MQSLFLIIFEILFLSVVIVSLYSLKKRFGLTLLFIFIGSNQYIQTILSANVYINFFDQIVVSPGSIVLFASSLFAILLIHIKEDVPQTRVLITGIVLANLTLTILTIFTSYQLNQADTTNLLSIPLELFKINVRMFLVGTALLIIDALALIIIYEFLYHKLKWVPLLGRILIALVAVWKIRRHSDTDSGKFRTLSECRPE